MSDKKKYTQEEFEQIILKAQEEGRVMIPPLLPKKDFWTEEEINALLERLPKGKEGEQK